MKNLVAAVVSLGIALAAGQHARADAFDIGVGLGFADEQGGGFEGGWDLQAGYEGLATDKWNIGGQVHLIRGWTSKSEIDAFSDTSMYFQSTALYATARPQIEWARWLQLKGGVVSARFKTSTMEGSGTGVALGAGVVLGNEKLRFHVLDFYRYQIDGHGFNVYTFSLAVLLGVH